MAGESKPISVKNVTKVNSSGKRERIWKFSRIVVMKYFDFVLFIKTNFIHFQTKYLWVLTVQTENLFYGTPDICLRENSRQPKTVKLIQDIFNCLPIYLLIPMFDNHSMIQNCYGLLGVIEITLHRLLNFPNSPNFINHLSKISYE